MSSLTICDSFTPPYSGELSVESCLLLFEGFSALSLIFLPLAAGILETFVSIHNPPRSYLGWSEDAVSFRDMLSRMPSPAPQPFLCVRKCYSRPRICRNGSPVFPVLCQSRQAEYLQAMGIAGPPCGLPSIRRMHTPLCIITACRNRRIIRSNRLSPIHLANRDIRMSWLTRSKNFSRSTSTTISYPSLTYSLAL